MNEGPRQLPNRVGSFSTSPNAFRSAWADTISLPIIHYAIFRALDEKHPCFEFFLLIFKYLAWPDLMPLT